MDYFDMLLARKLSGGGASSEAMISDEYDSTKTYAKGDYCIYNNTLYKCKTAISTPEEWNASHWDATIVTDELSQLKGVDDDIQEMIGDEYSSSSAYAVGDYCIYNNTLYKCTTAISTAEAWNPSHWTPTSCDTELSELKTDLVNLTQLASGTYHFTQSQTYEYTGVSFTIPSNKIGMVAIETLYAQTKPLGTIISNSNDTLGNHVLFEYKNDASYPTNVTPFYLLSSGTYYVWSKRNSTVTSGNDPINVYGKLYNA